MTRSAAIATRQIEIDVGPAFAALAQKRSKSNSCFTASTAVIRDKTNRTVRRAPRPCTMMFRAAEINDLGR
jgi:hypothetical protein